MNNDKESIIAVVTAYNEPGLIKRCLANISRQTRPVEDVILVDNSTKESACLEIESLCNRYGFNYTHPGTNLGSAGGFALGMEKAYDNRATWIWLHDHDDYPNQTCLQRLLGLNNGLIRSPMIIDPSTGKVLKYFKRMNGKLGYLYTAPPYSKVVDVAGTAGLLVHRDVISKIGLYDPVFFVGFEDYDYCLRAKEGGFSVFCSGKAIVYHPMHQSQSIRSSDGLDSILRYLPAFWGMIKPGLPRDYYTVRNFIILSRRHQRIPVFLVQMMFSIMLVPIVKCIIPGSSMRKTLKTYVEALCAG